MATTIIQVRRDTAANWTSNNPILATGELGFETDTGLFKIGRNDTDWTSLAYAQVAGPTGPEGAVGPVGEVGLTGAPGENGMNGAPGDNGLSAYEIWLNLGNSGSEQDFIDSLAGEDGVAGVDGLNGANGAAGAAGANGLGYDLQVPAVYAGRSAFGPLAAKVSWNPSFGTKAFVVGSRVRATLISDPSKYVEGTLTTFNYLPDGGVEETYYGVYFYNDIDTTGYGVFDELGTFDGSDTWKISVAGEVGTPANIQQLVLSYGASSPNTNSGNWTNNAGTPSVSGTLGFPDQYSQQFTIEKTSETSVIEINFDAVFDIAFNQNLGWGSS
jgi:hypothetical protein